MADATYIEPIHWKWCVNHRKRAPGCGAADHGRPDGAELRARAGASGVLAEFGVTMIGATADAIDKAEDRRRFDIAMKNRPRHCALWYRPHDGRGAGGCRRRWFPCIIRPSFTMGGTGGGIAYNREEFEEICERGRISLRPTNC